MFPKPEPLARRRTRKARDYQKARKACVTAVWGRAGGQCEVCHRAVCQASETDQPLDIGHVHEIVFRSRGGSATDPKNCELRCAACHAAAHGVTGRMSCTR